MKIVDIINYLWDGVDIPITKEEIQHSVNVFTYGLKQEILDNENIKELNDEYNNQKEFFNLTNN